MRRTTLLPLAAAAAVLALLAGCSDEPAIAIGAAVTTAGGSPAVAPPGGSSPAGAPTGPATGTTTSHSPAGNGTTGRATTGSRAATGDPTTSPASARTVRAPATYQRAGFDLPQRPSGYATVSGQVPAGWTAHRSTTGVGWWSATGAIDRRDGTGALLVRYRHQPATGETDDASLAAVIDGYRALPGAAVTVTRPAYQARIGLRAAEWTVDVPVGAVRRTALVAAWSLNGQVVTVYVSAPHGSERAARILYAHATDLRIYTHLGPEAG
ncbi:MAG TPA: hypothetical protein VI357_04870 [Mycobacteriales bacterium]